MKKTIWIIVALIIIIIIGVSLSNKAPKETGPIKFGFVGPLTGDAATLGVNAKIAAEIAVSEINAKGGIDGRTVELIAEDGKCNGADANKAANKLINVDKVVAIIGGLCSAESSAFTDLANTSQVPVISYGSSAPKLTEAGEYFFRNYPSDSYESVFAAQYIRNVMQKNKVAILYTKDDYGVGLYEAFNKSFTDAGGQIVAIDSFEKSSRDIRTQIAKVKAANPELIYFIGFTEASIPGINQIKTAGIDAQLFGSSSWSDTKIWEELGQMGEGSMLVTLATHQSAEFTEKMKNNGAAEVTLGSTNAYDATNILAQVIEAVGTNGSDMIEYLYDTVFEGTVTNDSTDFDENGDLIGADYIVNKIVGGKIVPIQ